MNKAFNIKLFKENEVGLYILKWKDFKVKYFDLKLVLKTKVINTYT